MIIRAISGEKIFYSHEDGAAIYVLFGRSDCPYDSVHSRQIIDKTTEIYDSFDTISNFPIFMLATLPIFRFFSFPENYGKSKLDRTQ